MGDSPLPAAQFVESGVLSEAAKAASFPLSLSLFLGPVGEKEGRCAELFLAAGVILRLPQAAGSTLPGFSTPQPIPTCSFSRQT